MTKLDEPSTPAARTLHALVVEDDLLSAMVLEHLVRSLNLRCRVARDLPSAREILATEPADLILCDQLLPGEEGLSLCRHVREHGSRVGASYTWFMLLSGVHSHELALAAHRAGVDDYQEKPLEPELLRARLEAALRLLGRLRALGG